MQQAQIVQAADPAIAEARPWLQELKEGRDKYANSRTRYGTETLTEIEEIELDNVGYSYGEPGQGNALDGVSFKARRGQLVGVIGPSGSGKSTLSELIVRLDDPTFGTFRVNGRPATDFDRESWTARVVLVPQLGHLISASVEDNIRFLRENVTEEAVRSAADRAPTSPATCWSSKRGSPRKSASVATAACPVGSGNASRSRVRSPCRLR